MKSGLLGHPLHSALAHFPVALLSSSFIWTCVGLSRNEPLWWSIGFWNTAMGLGFALFTMYAGFMDFAAIPKAIPAYRRARLHMTVMIVAVALFGCSAVLIPGPATFADFRSWIVFALQICGTLTITAGGVLGGRLVYKDGVGHEPADRSPGSSTHSLPDKASRKSTDKPVHITKQSSMRW